MYAADFKANGHAFCGFNIDLKALKGFPAFFL
ncbi:hypothetical protein M5D96_011209 [Drosophila gunungcola]|uniref:Uncharacterized protein n=1 Tax=Drosophila gunungcola TaxID=103775 RepID=A0A9P9YG69_9MUSC|nr:hypothetical protein M5D96_011209 [Drosophila gunungcola]